MSKTISTSFVAFCHANGTPKVRRYESLNFTALLCRDDEGDEVFINPGRTGLTLVDFEAEPQAIAEALSANKDNLVVLTGSAESDGHTVYTLVDKLSDFADDIDVDID